MNAQDVLATLGLWFGLARDAVLGAGLDGAVVAALVTALLAYLDSRRRAGEQRLRLLAALVGDLAALARHYSATHRTFSNPVDPQRADLHLRMAKVGSLDSLTGENLSKIKIDSGVIPNLIQLMRFVRNNDLHCDALLTTEQDDRDQEYQRLAERMDATIKRIDDFLRTLSREHRKLVNIAVRDAEDRPPRYGHG